LRAPTQAMTLGVETYGFQTPHPELSRKRRGEGKMRNMWARVEDAGCSRTQCLGEVDAPCASQTRHGRCSGSRKTAAVPQTAGGTMRRQWRPTDIIFGAGRALLVGHVEGVAAVGQKRVATRAAGVRTGSFVGGACRADEMSLADPSSSRQLRRYRRRCRRGSRLPRRGGGGHGSLKEGCSGSTSPADGREVRLGSPPTGGYAHAPRPLSEPEC